MTKLFASFTPRPLGYRSQVFLIAAAIIAQILPSRAAADTGSDWDRVRITVGPALAPQFPGSNQLSLVPYFGLSHARAGDPFAFSAPDDGLSVPVYHHNGLSLGPAVGVVGKRSRGDAGDLHKVAFTVEVGGFLRYELSEHFRLSAVVRRGINGHRALTSMIGADYIARDKDRWLWSVGPRLNLASGRYARAYFGVTPLDSSMTGIAPFAPKGGAISVGAAASARRQLTDHWGLAVYTKYDRLLSDAANSPVVRQFGSRNQWSGGVGLSYTFERHSR